MTKIYKNKNYIFNVALLILFIITLLFEIYNVVLHERNVIIEAILLFQLLVVLSNSTINSSLFNKVKIINNVIIITDFMPQLFIKIPKIQVISIDTIECIFWSDYDLKSSIRTSRMKINKNSSFYDYIVSKSPRITEFLVFKIKNDLNAYMRYFNSLSKNDRIEILNYITSKNRNIKLRFGNGELKLYKIKNYS